MGESDRVHPHTYAALAYNVAEETMILLIQRRVASAVVIACFKIKG